MEGYVRGDQKEAIDAFNTAAAAVLQRVEQQQQQQRQRGQGASAGAAGASGSGPVATDATGHFSPSPTFESYVRALEVAAGASEDWSSDGSIESGFNMGWPLDGSQVCGQDLERGNTYRDVSSFMPMVMEVVGGHSSRLDEWMQHVLQEVKLKASAQATQPPRPNSSPLAAFYNAKAATFDSAAPSAAPDGGGTTGSRKRGRIPGSGAPSAAAAGPLDALRDGCCDVRVFSEGICQVGPLHLDRDLLSLSFATGYKLRDPGLAAAIMSKPAPEQRAGVDGDDKDDDGSDDEDDNIWCDGVNSYRNGFFGHLARVCSDAGNALVWGAADGGDHIKAFRAPGKLRPPTTDAACNRGRRNGQKLQYTLCSNVEGAEGCVAGLHVLGTKVMAVKGNGTVCLCDIADLPPQKGSRLEAYDEDNDKDKGEGEDKRYRGDMGCRDTDSDFEVTQGVRPTGPLFMLQSPLANSPLGTHNKGAMAPNVCGGARRGPSTSCQRVVEALGWHEGSSTLVASCEFKGENRFGSVYREDFVRLSRRALEPVGGGGDECEDDDDDDSTALWWPKRAKHQASDFKKYFSMPSSSVLSYTFSASARREVPSYQEHCFDRG